MTDTSNPTPKAGTRQEVPVGLDKAIIRFDHAKRERLRKEYDAALRCNKEIFEFDEQRLMTPYAGYLLEYLDQQLGVQHGG